MGPRVEARDLGLHEGRERQVDLRGQPDADRQLAVEAVGAARDEAARVDVEVGLELGEAAHAAAHAGHREVGLDADVGHQRGLEVEAPGHRH
ncbi:MAG: hypothetical protein ACK559_37400, partial [bacterium]